MHQLNYDDPDSGTKKFQPLFNLLEIWLKQGVWNCLKGVTTSQNKGPFMQAINVRQMLSCLAVMMETVNWNCTIIHRMKMATTCNINLHNLWSIISSVTLTPCIKLGENTIPCALSSHISSSILKNTIFHLMNKPCHLIHHLAYRKSPQGSVAQKGYQDQLMETPEKIIHTAYKWFSKKNKTN